MSVLGLDLGSQRTGWAWGDGDCAPEVGCWTFEPVGTDYGLLLRQLCNELDGLLNSGRPVRHVVYEAPLVIHNGPRTDSLHKLRLLLPLGCFVEYWAQTSFTARAEVLEASVDDLKLELTGDRRAKKEQMVAAARAFGVSLPSDPEQAKDAADAVAAWRIGVRQWRPQLATGWDAQASAIKGELPL